MALKPGTLLGPYEVLSLIGAGGMGEVYKGRDTRLDRLVALKVLAPHLVDHPEARQRFEREAQTVANLKHPNICVLYDIGKQEVAASEGTPAALLAKAGFEPKRVIHFLVLEYLEGETLAQRLAKGPLSLEQVLQYAAEVSDALDKAHRAGVTHRDIKPGNIMIVPQTGSGPKTSTKLLDFGLAKLKQEVLPNLPRSEWPTGMGAPTVQGTILGTPHYMAPEQAEGKVDELDARTDIFSFGATVYEMVTGKKAFDGKTPTSVIASILKEDPPAMSSRQPLTPPALDRVVKKCLRKAPEERWQNVRDVTEELEWIAESGKQASAQASAPVAPAPPVALPSRPRRWTVEVDIPRGSLAALVLATLVGVAVWTLKPTPPQPLPVTRTVITLPPGDRLAGGGLLPVAFSPDGSHLVYVANRSGIQQLYLRSMDSLEARALAGTEGADMPFFSPDGQWVGFSAGGKLKKVPISGGAVLTLCDASAARGASWGTNDRIVFAPGVTSALFQVSAAGGTPEALTTLDPGKGEVSQTWPELLPGSKAVIFTSRSSSGTETQIVAQRLDTGERKALVQGASFPRFVPTGHLVYYRAGTVLAAPFDPERLEVTGSPSPVLEGVMSVPSLNTAGQFSISRNGSLVYVPGTAAALRTLVWVDRKGAAQPLNAPPRNYGNPRLSPDGQRLALLMAEENRDIWTYELARGTLTRLTFNAAEEETPVWAPDGKRLAFAGDRAGGRKLLAKLADGSGAEEDLLTTRGHTHVTSWSPDGQALAYEEQSPGTGSDIWVLSLKDDRKPRPFLQTPFTEQQAAFSPDGRWLAYMSNESGRDEVYVQPFPGPGGKWQISTEGGTEPVWARNGRELFYRNGEKMMVVDVNQSRDSNGAATSGFSASTPRVLFEGRYEISAPPPSYDIAPDGQRFLMIKANEQEQSATQINVVLSSAELV